MTLAKTPLRPLSENPLRLYRHRMRLTQHQLATACQLSESMICQIERRQVVPSLQVAYRICHLTGIPLDRLTRFCLGEDMAPTL